MNSLLQRIELKLSPKNSLGDRYINYRSFVRAHGRVPHEFGSLNDAIYYTMTGPEARNPLRAKVTDKEHLKDYVRTTVGDKYNVPTLAVLRSMKEVERYRFPTDSVIKPTHMSGKVMFARQNQPIDLDSIRDWFATNYYWGCREPFYKSLRPKVIVEPMIFGSDQVEDYKFFCVNGDPRLIWVDLDRRTDHRRNFYSTSWERLPIALAHENGCDVPRPENLTEMLTVARRLAREFSLIRVDLYTSGKEILVGELTNSSDAGRGTFYKGESLAGEILFRRLGLKALLCGQVPAGELAASEA